MNLAFGRFSQFCAALAGVYVSGVQSYSHLTGVSLPCAEGRGCDQVGSSPAGHLGPVPTSVLGLVAYLAIAVLACIGDHRGERWLSALIAIGVVVSSALTLYSRFWIDASCLWCLASNIIFAMLALLDLCVGGRHCQWRSVPLRWAIAPIVVVYVALCATVYRLHVDGLAPLVDDGALAESSFASALPLPVQRMNWIGKTGGRFAYIDVQCLHCQDYLREALPEATKSRRPFGVRFFVPDNDEEGVAAAEIVAEAFVRKKGWDLLADCGQDGIVTLDGLRRRANKFGITHSGQSARQIVERDQQFAHSIRLSAVPTVFAVDPGQPIRVITARTH